MELSNDLISQFVVLSKPEKETKKEETVYGTIVEYDGQKYVKLDGSELLTPVSYTTNIENDERVSVMIKNHSAIVTGNISSPAARAAEVDSVATKIDEQGNAIAQVNNSITQIGNDIVQQNNTIVQIDGSITQINTSIEQQNSTIKTINSELTALNTSVDAINSDIKIINSTVETQDSTISAIDSAVKIVESNIESVNSQIGVYNSSFKIEDGVVTGLKGFEGEWIDVKDLSTDSLDAKYANVDFANIGQAAVEKFYAVSGIIKDLIIDEATVVKELVGVTISGDLIQGNTIKADKLIVLGDDGLYYKLNVNSLGEATASSDPKYQNGLDGSAIIAKSVTAEKVNVSDLVAFDATIGGFNIDEDSIYSGVKDTINNTTTGIYMDSAGQFVIGDSGNFVKFYKDADNTYKLAIAANKITLGSGKTVEDSIKEAADGVEIGGRNLARKTAKPITTTSTTATGADTYNSANMYWNFGLQLEAQEQYTLSFNYTFDWSSCVSAKPTALAGIGCSLGSGTGMNYTADSYIMIADFWKYGQGYDNGKFVYTFTTGSNSSYFAFRMLRSYTHNNTLDITGLKMTISNFKLEKGNKNTDWTAAPEDLEVSGVNLLINSGPEKNSDRNYSHRLTAGTLELDVPYSYSVWLKASEATTVRVYLNDDSGDNRTFCEFAKSVPLTTEYQYFVFENKMLDGNGEIEIDESIHMRVYAPEGIIVTGKNAKLEKGIRATNWTPAPEDVNEGIGVAQETAEGAADAADAAKKLADANETLLNVLCGDVDPNTVNLETLNSAIITIQKCLSTLVIDGDETTLLQQDGTGWTFNFADIKDDIENLNSNMENALEHRGHIQFIKNDGDPYILISAADTGFKLKLSSTGIEFLNAVNSSLAAITSDTDSMVVENATIKTELRQTTSTVNGEFIWKVRSNGNYGLSWKG